MESAFQFNPLAPEFQANPYPFYDMLRSNMPVFYLPDWNMWFLTRYEDNVAALKDARFGREITRVLTREQLGWTEDPPEALLPLYEVQGAWMLDRDPPDHTRLRTLVHKGFTPRMIERLRQRAEAITDELIDKAEANGGMDLIDEFALVLPVTLIAEMLGVPAEDHAVLHEWSTGIAHTLELSQPMEVYTRGAEVTVEFSAYIRKMIAQRRKNPQEDLISALVAAEAEGDKLSEDEMVAMCILLLFAGHETTVNLIGNGTLALLRNPDQWQKLKEDPGLLKTAVEELLRYDSPVQMTARWVMQDCEFAGEQMKAGQQVATLIGAANHDPAKFANPAQLDITRDPNPHFAFGSGIHFCLGAPLARMEGQIAFAALARRLPNLRLMTDNPPYRNTYVLRGLASLPVSF
jgi:cytochrome P450